MLLLAPIVGSVTLLARVRALERRYATSCVVLGYVVPTAVAAVCMSIAAAFIWWVKRTSLTREGRLDWADLARSVGLLVQFVTFVGFSIVILDSYDLATAMGQSTAFSGLFIGIWGLGSAAGGGTVWALFKYNPESREAWTKALLLVGLTCCLAGALAYTYVVLATVHVSEEDQRASGLVILDMVMLILARVLCGYGAGMCLQLNQVNWVHLCPREDRPKMMMNLLLANMIGIGAGPILAAGTHWAHFCPTGMLPIDDTVGMVHAIIVSAALIIVAVFFPSLKDTEDFQVDQTDRNQGSPQDEETNLLRKRVLIIGSLCMSSNRAFVIGGLEAASSLLLQIAYGYAKREIGLLIGAAFLVAVPLKIVQASLHDQMSVVMWIRLFAWIATCMTVLWLPGFYYMMGVESRATHSYFILFADAIIFPTLYSSDALASGIMQQHVLPAGSCLDANHTMFWLTVIVGVSRCMGTWTARGVIEVGGQGAYALLQISLCIVFMAIFEMTVRPNISADIAKKPGGLKVPMDSPRPPPVATPRQPLSKQQPRSEPNRSSPPATQPRQSRRSQPKPPSQLP